MKNAKVITHNRHFHVDELMAIALLHVYLFEGGYKVERTRDSKQIENAQNDSSVFVIDVGFKYDVDNLNFDHHQQGMNLGWDNGTPYSSCGLVWKWLRDTRVLHQKMNKDMMNLIEERLIKKIDAHDNGIEYWDKGEFISLYNRNHHDDKVMDRQFDRALKASIDYFHNFISSLKNEIESKKLIDKALNKYKDESVVVFSKNMKEIPSIVTSHKNKMMFIVPHSKGKWIVRSVAKSKNDLFSSRCKFPDDVCGLQKEDLKNIQGFDRFMFIHKNGHMGVIESDIEVAMKFAKDLILLNSIDE